MSQILIERIKVQNFKSFAEIDIKLRKFNVIIGANASGKSNFISIFKFLKDINESGLDNAISMQGGVDYVRNVSIGPSKDLSIEVHISSKEPPMEFPLMLQRGKRRRPAKIEIDKLMYKFSVEFYKRKKGYRVKEEFVEAMIRLSLMKRKDGEPIESEKLGKATLTMMRDRKGRFRTRLEPKDLPITVQDILPQASLIPKEMFLRKGVPKELFLLNSFFAAPICFVLSAFFSVMAVYDIDPKLSKRSTLITGKTDLEMDGSNLAIVLKNILATKKDRERISNLIKELLPFIEDISVEKLADKSLIACLREVYYGKRFLPASLISDGTINLTAIIVALYFEENPLMIIEEPGRNIHPYLISRLIDMMKDASERLKRQIIITTHNPEVVKYAGIKNILLVYRDNSFSKISEPHKKKEVKQFLENKMGVDELYVQNLLKW